MNDAHALADDEDQIDPGDDTAPDDDAPDHAPEPPPAEALGIDVAGLPPQRARLVRFVAWRDRCRAELRRLEEGRAALDSMSVPAVTEDRLRKLIEADTSNFVA